MQKYLTTLTKSLNNGYVQQNFNHLCTHKRNYLKIVKSVKFDFVTILGCVVAFLSMELSFNAYNNRVLTA